MLSMWDQHREGCAHLALRIGLCVWHLCHDCAVATIPAETPCEPDQVPVVPIASDDFRLVQHDGEAYPHVAADARLKSEALTSIFCFRIAQGTKVYNLLDSRRCRGSSTGRRGQDVIGAEKQAGLSSGGSSHMYGGRKRGGQKHKEFCCEISPGRVREENGNA